MYHSISKCACTALTFTPSVHIFKEATIGAGLMRGTFLQHGETSGDTDSGNSDLLRPRHDASSTGEGCGRWRGGGEGAVGRWNGSSADRGRGLDLAVGDLGNSGSRGLDLAVGDLGDSTGRGLDLAVGDLGDGTSGSLDLAVGDLGNDTSRGLDLTVGDLRDGSDRGGGLDLTVGDLGHGGSRSLNLTVGDLRSTEHGGGSKGQDSEGVLHF